MDKQILSSFRFEDYKINNINYVLNEEYEATEAIETEYGLGLGIKISSDCKQAEINLEMDIFSAVDKPSPYKLKISILGWFSTDDIIKESDFIDFCKINATAILYPYLRSAVTDITKVGNIQPLVLPLVNIYRLIKASENIEIKDKK